LIVVFASATCTVVVVLRKYEDLSELTRLSILGAKGWVPWIMTNVAIPAAVIRNIVAKAHHV
jgi:hypothetical protein